MNCASINSQSKSTRKEVMFEELLKKKKQEKVHLLGVRHCSHLIGVQKFVKSADNVILSLLLYRTPSKFQLWEWILVYQKHYFDKWLTLFPSNYFVNNSNYQTFVDLGILNPTITVIFMAKFNPTITAYFFFILQVYYYYKYTKKLTRVGTIVDQKKVLE